MSDGSTGSKRSLSDEECVPSVQVLSEVNGKPPQNVKARIDTTDSEDTNGVEKGGDLSRTSVIDGSDKLSRSVERRIPVLEDFELIRVLGRGIAGRVSSVTPSSIYSADSLYFLPWSACPPDPLQSALISASASRTSIAYNPGLAHQTNRYIHHTRHESRLEAIRPSP
jgi:hypothetical protein